MRRTRQVIAVMEVATALCAAERSPAALAAPVSSRPNTAGFARTLAQKLTSSFRQSVSVVRVQPVRADETASTFPLAIREEASGVRADLSPFQFPLPPPTL
jgi:hypothetical protein